MKKIINSVFLLLFLSAFLFAISCSDSHSVKVDLITEYDNIYVQTEGKHLSFNVPFCSRKKINDVTFIRFSDPALNNLGYRVDVTDAGSGLLDDYKYRGAYVKYITFTVTGDETSGEFNLINLSSELTAKKKK